MFIFLGSVFFVVSSQNLLPTATPQDAQQWLLRNRFSPFCRLFTNFSGKKSCWKSPTETLTHVCGHLQHFRQLRDTFCLRTSSFQHLLSWFLHLSRQQINPNNNFGFTRTKMNSALLTKVKAKAAWGRPRTVRNETPFVWSFYTTLQKHESLHFHQHEDWRMEHEILHESVRRCCGCFSYVWSKERLFKNGKDASKQPSILRF